jgi:hypothetical protein
MLISGVGSVETTVLTLCCTKIIRSRLLKLLERIADIASDIAAVRVFLLFGIDPLKAVPLEDF